MKSMLAPASAYMCLDLLVKIWQLVISCHPVTDEVNDKDLTAAHQTASWRVYMQLDGLNILLQMLLLFLSLSIVFPMVLDIKVT